MNYEESDGSNNNSQKPRLNQWIHTKQQECIKGKFPLFIF